MELNDVKDWSYDDFDKSISSNEEEISRLREANKKLREVKSRKMMTESLSMITDNGIDFSLADLQAFLQSRKNSAVTDGKENQSNDAAHEEKTSSEEIPVVEEVAPAVEEIAKENAADVLSNPDFLEEETTPQSVNSRSETRKKMAELLNLPENSSVIEIRRAFELDKNTLPVAIANSYEEIISELERGEKA